MESKQLCHLGGIFLFSMLVHGSAAFLCVAQQPIPERFPNVASSNFLPQGAGIAAQFKADTGIADHPDVIFADNFETGELGAKWDSDTIAKTLSFSDPGSEICGQRCLRVEATLGQNTGGGLTKWFVSADRVFVRFYVRFDPDCDYIHHFVTLRANKGLQGRDRWSGFGGAGSLPAGDERFSTALEPWGKELRQNNLDTYSLIWYNYSVDSQCFEHLLQGCSGKIGAIKSR